MIMCRILMKAKNINLHHNKIHIEMPSEWFATDDADGCWGGSADASEGCTGSGTRPTPPPAAGRGRFQHRSRSHFH